MPVITLTSDLGFKDYYVAALKGYLIKQAPDAKIVDISNQITPFNIAEAAYILRNCFRDFPEGTLHLIGVDGAVNTPRNFLIIKVEGHFFFTRDTGMVSLITDEQPEYILKLKTEEPCVPLFPMKTVLAAAAAKIATGTVPEKLGEKQDEMLIRSNLRPIIEKYLIRGTVIHIDHYGNAIVNVSRRHLERFSPKRKLNIYYSRNSFFRKISSHYEEVPDGEKVCFFNNSDFLEIAINKGNASKLLGLNIGHTILIELQQ